VRKLVKLARFAARQAGELANDPWVQGSVALFLVKRSFEGIQQQFTAVQAQLAAVQEAQRATAAGLATAAAGPDAPPTTTGGDAFPFGPTSNGGTGQAGRVPVVNVEEMERP
jgi:hypothetical protein